MLEELNTGTLYLTDQVLVRRIEPGPGYSMWQRGTITGMYLGSKVEHKDWCDGIHYTMPGTGVRTSLSHTDTACRCDYYILSADGARDYDWDNIDIESKVVLDLLYTVKAEDGIVAVAGSGAGIAAASDITLESPDGYVYATVAAQSLLEWAVNP